VALRMGSGVGNVQKMTSPCKIDIFAQRQVPAGKMGLQTGDVSSPDAKWCKYSQQLRGLRSFGPVEGFWAEKVPKNGLTVQDRYFCTRTGVSAGKLGLQTGDGSSTDAKS